MNESIYQSALLAHHKSPVGFQDVFAANVCKTGHNPACGDEIEVSIKLDEHSILAISFDGESCAICRASASIMCQQIQQLDIKETVQLIKGIEQKFQRKSEFNEGFEPLNAVHKFPIRVQCALLPWRTLNECLKEVDC